jgi:PleD family two-component response regulator
MKDSNIINAKAYLAGLDDSLSAELIRVLRATSCELTDDPSLAQIVFCPWQAEAFREAAARFRHVPVVVVSRLPEVQGWLDALEAGAADYCASPFEKVQIQWLLERHVRPARRQPPEGKRAAAA